MAHSAAKRTGACSATATAPARSTRLPLRVRLRGLYSATTSIQTHIARHRDDAAAKGQLGRQRIFDGLLDRLDEAAS